MKHSEAYQKVSYEHYYCATVLGELSVILSRNAGPYIHTGGRDVTTYFLKHKIVTGIYKYILIMSLLAYLLIGR